MAAWEQDGDPEVQRNYRHNYWMNLLDGTLFWCGSSFIAVRTVLPVYISHFTSSGLLIGLLSMIATTGWLVPQLFTANWVQRLPRKKVLPVNLGLFSERLPVLLMAPSVLLARRSPTLALTLFFVLLTWHMVGAGLIAVAWQDMIGKIIPANRIGRFLGLTNFLGTGTGVLGAWGTAWVLDRHGFPSGYIWCFAVAGILILVSWVFLALVREPAGRDVPERVSDREYWRRLPSVLRSDANFARYLLSQVVGALGGMAIGFLAVYGRERWQLPDSQAGILTASMLIGQALANLLFGPLADRRGHKLVLEVSMLLGVAAMGLAMLAPSPTWLYGVFALLGANSAGMMLSGLMIALDFGPADQRATYIGLNNTVRGVASGLAPLLGGWLATALGYQPLFAASFAVGLAGLALLRWSVREPRLEPVAVK